ncbi:MAG: hypothetical protein ACYTDX_00465 [Planctomycetota bacterium]|jgi:hypothetical protein
MKPGTLPALTLATMLLAGFAVPAAAQDSGTANSKKAPAEEEDGASDLEKEIQAKIAKELDQRVEVKGKRYQISLKRGSRIIGVLPRGLIWEKLDRYGDYVECKETDKGSGLRLQFVMGMDGDIFIKRDDMKGGTKGLKDLGQLTEAQKSKIRDEVIKARRKVIVEREKTMRKELNRLLADREAKDGQDGDDSADGKGGDGDDDDDAMTKEEKEGEALLKKFPPPEWSEDRVTAIKEREVVNGIYRNKEEGEFIDNFRAWKKALARRMLKEAEEDSGGDGK